MNNNNQDDDATVVGTNESSISQIRRMIGQLSVNEAGELYDSMEQDF